MNVSRYWSYRHMPSADGDGRHEAGVVLPDELPYLVVADISMFCRAKEATGDGLWQLHRRRRRGRQARSHFALKVLIADVVLIDVFGGPGDATLAQSTVVGVLQMLVRQRT